MRPLIRRRRDDRGLAAAPKAAAASPPRFVRYGGAGVVRLGERRGWHDFYHAVLTVRWPTFLAGMALAYIAGNLLFALLYLAGGNGIANARPGSFMDAFFFSVQTMATIGYGVMYPQTLYANILMTTESLLGMIAVAIGAGLVFTRVSRPTARVLFSRYAVIMPFDGVPTLMFRAANQRQNQIFAAQVQATLARKDRTSEGHEMRRIYDLRLSRAQNPLFALTWTIMHPIDPSSPLHGMDREALVASEAEIIVTIAGTDETFAQPIHARHSFSAQELIWDRRLADILSILPDGRRAVDYSRFHDVLPL